MVKIKKGKFALALKIVDGKLQSRLRFQNCRANELALVIATLESMKTDITNVFSKLTKCKI